MIYKNSFFFCVLTQQGHGQTKLTVKSLDEIYQYLKYLESGFSNKTVLQNMHYQKTLFQRELKLRYIILMH